MPSTLVAGDRLKLSVLLISCGARAEWQRVFEISHQKHFQFVQIILSAVFELMFLYLYFELVAYTQFTMACFYCLDVIFQ